MFQSIAYNSYFRKRIIISLMLILVPVVVAQIWVANRLAVYGENINGMEQVKKQLILENQILENQIAQAGSLDDIGNTAKMLGFQKIKNNVEYLGGQSIASK
jgi:hypothetical protein